MITINKYRQYVTDIRYLADCTHPDLAYVASQLRPAIHRHTTRH